MTTGIPPQMVENEVEDDIAICPLCYCPYNPHVEDCPECTPPASDDEMVLPVADCVNPEEAGSWFSRLSRSISSHISRSLFRSNEK